MTNASNTERKKITNKSCKWLSEYINSITPNNLSEHNRANLFPIIRSEFRKLMADSNDFYEEVEAFCSERRTRNEKDMFCRHVVTIMVTSGSIQRTYARKHPDEYRVPEKYRKTS